MFPVKTGCSDARNFWPWYPLVNKFSDFFSGYRRVPVYCMGKVLCEFIVKFMGGCAQRYIQGSSFCFVIVSHQAFVLSLYMSDTNRMAWVESQSSAFELGLERTHPQMHSRMYPRMYRTTHQHTHPRNMHPITHP